MTCPNCGGRVPLKASHCPTCGEPVERPYAAGDIGSRWQAWSNPEPEERAGGRTARSGGTPGPVPRSSRSRPGEPGGRPGAGRPADRAPERPARREPPRPPVPRPKPGRRPAARPKPNARRNEPAPEELPPPRPPRGWGEPRAVAMVGTLAGVVAFLAVVLGIESALSAPSARLAVPPATTSAGAGPSGTAMGGAGASPSAVKPSVELAKLADPHANETAYARYDDCNKRFEYSASNMLDGDPASAWRVSGDGTGDEITFSFDDPHVFTAVGLINGHAKKDACSGADRYAQERRITRVTWTFDGKNPVHQKLAPTRRALQRVPVDSVVASVVTLKIEGVTLPAEGRLDYTPISEVSLVGR